MKKNIRTEKTRSKDQTTVIPEDIRSQFMVFGEGLNSVSDKLNNLTNDVRNQGKVQNLLPDKLDNFTKDTKDQFMAFGEGQDLLSSKVDKIDERLEKVEVKIDKINERLIRIEDDVVEIKHKLSEKVDLKDFQKLEKRFLKLEKIVFEKI